MRLLSSFIILLLVPSVGLALEMRLRNQAQVSGKQVLLHDLVEFVSADALVQSVGQLPLLVTPALGESKKLKRADIERLLQRKLGVSEIAWRGAKQVLIRREGVQVGAAQLDPLLNRFLVEQSARIPHVKLRFRSLVLPEPFEVPAGRLSFQLIPANPRVIGSRRLTLVTRVDDRVVSNLSLRVELEALAEVVVATGDLRRGTELGPAQLDLQSRDISGLRNPLFNAAELYGKRLKRSVRLGEPLQRLQVEFPPMIKRGELVSIQVRRGALTLTARGKSQQNGRAGEMIRVRNSQSRKEILARVVAPGQVVLEF